MQKITPFLTYRHEAEEAVNFYVSVFANSRIKSVMRQPSGAVMTIDFQLDGQDFMALNGGDSFRFANGISLFVSCKTQPEVDLLWEKLTASGGAPGPCGWLQDRFGVSWQIIPTALGRLLRDTDPQRARRAMEAMLRMSKIDMDELERAAQG